RFPGSAMPIASFLPTSFRPPAISLQLDQQPDLTFDLAVEGGFLTLHDDSMTLSSFGSRSYTESTLPYRGETNGTHGTGGTNYFWEGHRGAAGLGRIAPHPLPSPARGEGRANCAITAALLAWCELCSRDPAPLPWRGRARGEGSSGSHLYAANPVASCLSCRRGHD